MKADPDQCTFCSIVAGEKPASIVWEDEHSMAFLDLRQFHSGHVLIVSRAHFGDLRDADSATAAAVMLTTARVMRAVASLFKNDGLSVWHSAGEGAHQEVPHLHFHVHPRLIGDDVLRVYPSAPHHPPRTQLDDWASDIRQALTRM
ncbi:MAG: HIT domain-containing protein [Phycisphaerae bacterium]|nr:HIT domain-containing protein [Gemmatimonadaceae bacterium]